MKNNSNNNRFNIEEIFNKIKYARSSKYKNNFYFNYNNNIIINNNNNF